MKRKKPLERHMGLLRKMSANVSRPGSMYSQMRAAGYSHSYARSSTRLKQTQSWQALTEKYFSDASLVQKHTELLDSKKSLTMSFPATMRDADIRTVINALPRHFVINIERKAKTKLARCFAPDTAIQAQALDMAFRLRGKYDVKSRRTTFSDVSDEVLEEEIAAMITAAL